MNSYDLVGTMNKIKKYQKDMNELEDKYEKVVNNMKEQSIKKENLKNEFDKKNNATIEHKKQTDEQLVSSIKSVLSSQLQNGEKQFKEYDDVNKQLEILIEELYKKINSFDSSISQKIFNYNEKIKIKDEVEIRRDKIKDNYNAALEENKRLKKEIETRNVYIAGLNLEIEDLLKLIDKLTAERIRLNKYFLKYYEKFSEKDKKRIKELENEIYPEFENKNKDKIKQIEPEDEKINIENNIIKVSKKINNIPKQKGGPILNEQEYQLYKKGLCKKAYPQYHKKNEK